MVRWTGLAPWEFEFPFPGSLTSTKSRETTCKVDEFVPHTQLVNLRTVGQPEWGRARCLTQSSVPHRRCATLPPNALPWPVVQRSFSYEQRFPFALSIRERGCFGGQSVPHSTCRGSEADSSLSITQLKAQGPRTCNEIREAEEEGSRRLSRLEALWRGPPVQVGAGGDCEHA